MSNVYSHHNRRNTRLFGYCLNVLANDNMDVVEEDGNLCNILGFHPFKEILFLSSFREKEWRATVHAYQLNSSRVECLGNMRPTHYDSFEPWNAQVREYQYFPYTP